MKVIAAMSGGVDSAVAAARAAEAGHDVTGVHLALSRNPASYRSGARGCCTIEDANDARRAADVIGIPFYVWDLSERFHEDVVEDFMDEYAAGRTPNPCLRCNEKIKFAAVLDRALGLGFDAVATGHYAQLRTGADGLVEMHRAVDHGKDQSYVLGVLTQDQLAHSLFPLGGSHQGVGARGGRGARAAGRRQAGQPRHLLRRGRRQRRLAAREARRPGAQPRRPDRRRARPATELGPPRRHLRRSRSASARACGSGARPPDGEPRFVLDIEPVSGTVTWSAPRDRLAVDGLSAIRPRWCGTPPDRPSSAPSSSARTATSTGRSSGSTDGSVEIELLDPAYGIAPGQAVVVYDGTRVVGSATISATRRVTCMALASRASGRSPARTSTRTTRRCGSCSASCRTWPTSRRCRAAAPAASMTGRALAVMAALGVDLQPAGWRLTDASGVDHRRARSLLAQDLDGLEEQAQGYDGTFKVQVAGPWTLAATVERPRGDKVLADHGARRDLAQALAEGLRDHVARRTPPGPERRADRRAGRRARARRGAVRGRSRPPPGSAGTAPSTRPRRREALGWVLGAVTEVGAEPWVHSCATGTPLDLLRGAGARGLSVDLAHALRARPRRARRRRSRRGRPSRSASYRPPIPRCRPTDAQVTESVLRWLDMLGLDPDAVGDRLVLTPACGLAGASPDWAGSRSCCSTLRRVIWRAEAAARRRRDSPIGSPGARWSANWCVSTFAAIQE